MGSLEKNMSNKNNGVQILLKQNGDGFLGNLVPDFSTMLESLLTSSSSLGSRLSEKSYLGDIRRFNLWRGDRPITKNLIEEYLKYLSGKHARTDPDGRMIINKQTNQPEIISYSPAYVKRTLASLRWYVRKVKDLIDDNETLQELLPKEKRSEIRERADRCLSARTPRGSRAEGIQAGRYVPLEEFEKLIAACMQDHTRAGTRDRAMLALARQIGPRVHEIAGLSLHQVTRKPGPACAYQVDIIGKGNKQRPVKLDIVKNTALYLRDWLAIRGDEPGALFCRISYKDRLVNLDRHPTPHSLHMILLKRLEEAGYEPDKRFTWHDFRRTMISDIIESEGLATAQHMAGHSSSAQTTKYDRLWQDNVGKAIQERPDVSYLPEGKK